MLTLCFFFFSSRRRHTRSKRDWSSDVCSSDLSIARAGATGNGRDPRGQLLDAPAAAVRRRDLDRSDSTARPERRGQWRHRERTAGLVDEEGIERDSDRSGPRWIQEAWRLVVRG